MANTIITISREFGSGGHEIGKQAAERLGIECYDSRLIRMASEKSCISEKYLKDVDEKRANPWLYTVPSDYADEMTGFGLPLNDMLFNVQSQIIRQLAHQESCIIIGRCADFVLADYPGVTSFFIYMVVKGLMNYGSFVFARECVIRHMYFILDTLHPDSEKQGDSWEYYMPGKEGPASVPDGMENRKRYLPMLGLVSVALMIENVIGLDISLPRKTVNWTMQTLEEMGIEALSLKKNSITILSNKNVRGWEIRLESEKLYYFTIHILEDDKKKTLPIPSGKCSMLIDKL